MEKFLEILGKLKKYRDLIYIGIIITFGIIFSSQCSKIDRLNNEIDRQENNMIALTEQIVNYEDELGRANAEKHAYQLTQEELRDSIGLLKQKNKEYLSYINTNMNIRDTVTLETVIVKEVDAQVEAGSIKLTKSDVFGKSSRSFSVNIPYNVNENKLFTGDAVFALDQNIFVEGWLEKNNKTKETFVHLRTDYPGVTFNSGLGIVAEAGKAYERNMRKTWGLGVAVGPNFSFSYDFINQQFIPTVGVGVTIGLTYTPKFLQW
jgi:hypothetical protein